MMLSYIWERLWRKLPGAAIRDSKLGKPIKIGAQSTVIRAEIGGSSTHWILKNWDGKFGGESFSTSEICTSGGRWKKPGLSTMAPVYLKRMLKIWQGVANKMDFIKMNLAICHSAAAVKPVKLPLKDAASTDFNGFFQRLVEH